MVNVVQETLEFQPSFDEIVIQLDELIEHIVEGVAGIKRIEEHLFQLYAGLEIPDISVMKYSEEPVEDAKRRIEKVIRVNTVGPNQ